MRLHTTYCMLYVLIFNKPFLANLVSSKNVYMHVSLSIWDRNVHAIHQNLSWISLNANKLVLVSLLI